MYRENAMKETQQKKALTLPVWLHHVALLLSWVALGVGWDMGLSKLPGTFLALLGVHVAMTIADIFWMASRADRGDPVL